MAKCRKNSSTGAVTDAETAVQRKLHVEYRPIASLEPYAKNARTHSEAQIAQIAASMRKFGITNPVLIDESGGIIAGHGRVMAASSLGIETIPCIELAGLTDAEKRAYILADNKLALNAGWDEAILSSELRELKESDIDMSLIGFDPAELMDLLEGKDVEFKEFDETTADDVQLVTCPKCGNSFPK